MMSNAKGESQTQLEALIPKLWDAWENKSLFIQQINQQLASKKTKILEKSCLFIETLIQSSNIEELQYLKPLTKNLVALTKQKSPLIRKAVVKVFKEAYLWMGDLFDPILNNANMDGSTKKELEKYKEGVMSSEMKVGVKKQKK